jgi:hypothetical protein
MKKLLILMLILGMTSTINAAVVLSVDGDTSHDWFYFWGRDTVAIGIHSDNTDDYMAYLDFRYVSQGGFELNNPRFVTGMVGSRSEIVGPYPYGDSYELEITVATAPGEINTTGVQFEIDLTCFYIGIDVLVELYDGAAPFPVLDTLIIGKVGIPEPMTVALLGLGGLFLLRRRK